MFFFDLVWGVSASCCRPDRQPPKKTKEPGPREAYFWGSAARRAEWVTLITVTDP